MKYSDVMNEKSLMDLRADAFTANREYGEIINSDEDAAEIIRKKNVVADRVAKYNSECQKHTFKHWLEDDMPIKAALLDAVYPVLKQTVKGKKGAQTVGMADETRVFTLTDFINYANEAGYDNPVKDPAWLKPCEESHKALCGFLASEMHSEKLKDQFLNEFDLSFAMKTGDDNCGEVDLKTRFSKGNIDRTMQALLDAILYEDIKNGGKNAYRVTADKRNMILYTYANLDNKTIGNVLFKNTTKYMEDITKVFSAIVKKCETTFDKYPTVSSK